MFAVLTIAECLARDEGVWDLYFAHCAGAESEEAYYDRGYEFIAMWALVALACGHCGPNREAMVRA